MPHTQKPRQARDNLPKTRSGKIMRRLRGSVTKGEAITKEASMLKIPAIRDQFSEPN